MTKKVDTDEIITSPVVINSETGDPMIILYKRNPDGTKYEIKRKNIAHLEDHQRRCPHCEKLSFDREKSNKDLAEKGYGK